MLHKKLKAFTLAETLVALVLMVIIVGIASTIISLTSRNIEMIKQNENGYRDLEQLEMILELDFARAYQIEIQDSVLTLTNPISNILYKARYTDGNNKRFLLRKSDTLLFHNFEWLFYKNGDRVTKGRIDAVELRAPKTKHFIFISKPNDLTTELQDYGF